jgi:aspartyl protease family protein
MSRLVFAAIVLVMLSLYGASVLEETVVAPKDDKAVAKVEPRKPANPYNVRNVIIRPENGQFATDGRVDGRPIAFLVDTGASQIALRESEAARLGYRPHPRDYVVTIRTANGEGRAAPIKLGTVEVGDIIVRDVAALVVSDNALGVNLLGMSFLSRVRWVHDRGLLVLEQ